MEGIVTTGKINSNGSEIKFTTEDNVSIGSSFKMPVENRFHYYEATSVELGDNNNLIVTAKEVGYWARKLDRYPDFNLRNIVGLKVEQMTGIEELKKLREASCWC